MERGNVRELPRPLSWKAERKYLAGLKSESVSENSFPQFSAWDFGKVKNR